MTKRITEGSLVCTKRKIEGMGIVLKRVKNINEYAEFDLSGAFIDVFNLALDLGAGLNTAKKVYTTVYTRRSKMIRELNAKIIEKKPEVELELLQKFWSHNREYSHQFNPKKRKKLLKAKLDFCLVNWTKAPSNYHGVPARHLHRKNVWMSSSSIRNKT